MSQNGNVPSSRFGHTLTYFDDNKAVLFGGATGSANQFSVTDHAYILDLKSDRWKKMEGRNTSMQELELCHPGELLMELSAYKKIR